MTRYRVNQVTSGTDNYREGVFWVLGSMEITVGLMKGHRDFFEELVSALGLERNQFPIARKTSRWGIMRKYL